MAKPGFATREEAEEAAERHNRWVDQHKGQKFIDPKYLRYKVPYHYTDPATGERKWFLRYEREF